MSQSDQVNSTQIITPQLIGQIVDAIRNKAYGSIEIYIQNHQVVQITERTITKVGSLTAKKTYSPSSNKDSTSKISDNINTNR